MSFSIHNLYRHIFKLWRKRRFQLFLQLLKPNPSDILLDVGGLPSFWVLQPQPVKRIDTLNLKLAPWGGEQATKHNIRTLGGDGGSLAMPDKGSDIGFPNSAIEHVGS